MVCIRQGTVSTFLHLRYRLLVPFLLLEPHCGSSMQFDDLLAIQNINAVCLPENYRLNVSRHSQFLLELYMECGSS